MRSLKTGDSGQFQAGGLPIGGYSLRFERNGFNPAVVESLTVSVSQTVKQRIIMNLAAVTEKIDVQKKACSSKTSAGSSGSLGGLRTKRSG